jgi:signal transduction histidine kinase
MNSPFHSIRWRVQAWHGLILLGAVIAFCFTAYRLAWNNQLRTIDQGLWVDEARLGAGLMRNKPSASMAGVKAEDNPPFSPARLVERLRSGAGTLPPEVASIFEGTAPGYAYFSLRDASDRVYLQSANAPEGLALLPMPAGPYADEWLTIGHRREVLRSSSPGLRSLIGRDISPELDAMHRFAWSLGGSGLAVWLLGLLGGWWLAGRAMQPITIISRTAARIAEGNLQERISPSGTDSELDQLGRVLNHTFDRLQAGMDQQKQFIADASHELRTPVTVLLSETHRILKPERERTPEEYRQVIQTCRDSAQRMRKLIEPLLLLTRQESQGTMAPREPCDLSGILRATLEQLGPLAAAREIRLHADLQPAACLGDPAALAILATNLLANALQHNRDGGGVFVRCEHRDRSAILTVRDDGPGIPPEDLPHVFERFYRGDKARASADGHAGLGLAIARTIAENHGGTITAQSTFGEGAMFTVTLPSDGVQPNP